MPENKPHPKWTLTDELLASDVVAEIKAFIEQYEANPTEDEQVLELTDKGINVIQLKLLLQKLGYEEIGLDANGWQVDYWYYFHKDKHKAVITGTMIVSIMSLCLTPQ
jgi:CCR4-NOT transcriptional regulation complex NOT5 subunit